MITDEKNINKNSSHLRRLCRMGMFIALALILSYLESLLPIQPAIPGVKLGLANLATMVALYSMDAGAAFAISVCRVVLASILFGNLTMMLYSLSGAVFSLVIMIFLRRFACFSPVGVCIAGGSMHNIGQLLVAGLVVETKAIWYYFPLLCVAGVISGLLIGILSGIVIQRQKTGGDYI